jgi:lipopolysaccharide export system protein LptA
MKRILPMAGVIAFAALAGAQTNSARISANDVAVGARVSNRQIPGISTRLVAAERTVRLTGNVILTTDTEVIRADGAVVYPDTNKVELQGNVTVQLAAPPVISK